MKKSIVGVATFLLVGFIGAPYLSGSIAESETRRIVDQFNQQSDEYGTTDIVSYERGIRSSQVVYQYRLPRALALMTGISQKFNYSCDYEHGISGIDYDCDLLETEAYRDFIDQYFDGKNPVAITGAISIFGGLTQTISSKVIEKTLEDGSVMKLGASEIVMDSDNDFSDFTVKANIGAIELKDSGGVMQVSESTMITNFSRTELGLFEGDYRVKVDSFKTLIEQEKLNFEGLELNGSSAERGDKMDASGQLKVSRIDSTEAGDQVLEDVRFEADLLGLNSQALLEYQRFTSILQADLMANVEHGGSSDIDPNQMMALLPVIEKLMDKGLNIKASVSGQINGKQNRAGLDLKLLEQTSFSQFSALLFAPDSVLKKLDFQVNGSLNKKLVDGKANLAPLIAKSPLFVDEGDAYQLELRLAEHSELNGKKVTFQELQSLVMSSMM